MYGDTQEKNLRKNKGKALFQLFKGMLLYFINCILCLQPEETGRIKFSFYFSLMKFYPAKFHPKNNNKQLDEGNRAYKTS